MPYNNKDASDLPSYVKKLSDPMRAKWVDIFNTTYEDEGEDIAFIVANSWLKRKIKEMSAVARTEKTIDVIKFTVDETQELITRSENGEDIISFKLADVFKDQFGLQLNESLLQKWATSINNGETILGDIDHQEYDRLEAAGLDPDEIASRMKKSKPGIAKSLKAMVKDGKLWIQAAIDKRYRKLIEGSKGVSMEALIIRDANKQVVDGNLFGFTFGVNHQPAISGTEVFT